MQWLKPSGAIIETNDLEATIEHCHKIGWTPNETNKINDGGNAKSHEEESDKKEKITKKKKVAKKKTKKKTK